MADSKESLWEQLPTLSQIREMKLRVEHVVEKIIPKGAVTILHAPGGTFKTWLMLEIGRCVQAGVLFLGLATKRMPVYYLDYENPLSVLKERAGILGPSEMRVWHLSSPAPPPRFDDKGSLRDLEDFPRGLIIVDSLRASQGADENDSKEMTAVMNNFKHLRELGFTVVILHHASKGKPKSYRGSTVVQDQSDHLIVIERSSARGPQPTDAMLKISLGEKTRFEPFDPVTIGFRRDTGFYSINGTLDKDLIEEIRQLLQSHGRLNQGEIRAKVRTRKRDVAEVLRSGEGKHWTSKTEGSHHSLMYELIAGPETKDREAP